MATPNAERQRQYRERALRDPDGLLLARLQVMLSSRANGALKRICSATGKNQREIVETALLEMQRALGCNE
jgi:hypothetical protein